jgi:hypothetical protein
MAERDTPIPSGHTPQHNPEMEPRPDPSPDQDRGDTTEFLEQLAGTNTDGTAYVDVRNVEPLDDMQTFEEGASPTDLYQGDTDANQIRGEGGAESYDLLVERELRAGETDDVMDAIEEGLTYVPPIDPPTVTDPDDPESIQVASGFSVSADDESDLDAREFDSAGVAEDDMRATVRRALRNDSLTSHLADRLHITTVNGTVIVRGEVDDLEDTDNIVAVISDLPDVEAVRDETTVRGL